MTAGEAPQRNLTNTSRGSAGPRRACTPHWTFGSEARSHTAPLFVVVPAAATAEVRGEAKLPTLPPVDGVSG